MEKDDNINPRRHCLPLILYKVQAIVLFYLEDVCPKELVDNRKVIWLNMLTLEAN